MSAPVTDLQSLLEATRSGAQLKYLFFWGHQARSDGRIGTSCLSQWWPAEFEVEGVRYPTAEHFMMAEKARLFGDEAMRQKIVAAAHPNAAKKLGRQVAAFDGQIWQAHRFEIVVRGNRAKFGQNPALTEFLLNTGSRVLVEASPTDRIWGIGLTAADPEAGNPEQWPGLNLLGFALMAARRQLSQPS